MNDAVPVCVAESLRDLLADFAGLVERLTLSPFHDRRKRLAIYEFHHQKGNALVLANVEDSYDARMRQSPRGSRFPIKALTRLFPLTARQRRREDCLHSNNAINSGIARSKNASHGTLPQFIENLVAANVLREIHTRKRSRARDIWRVAQRCLQLIALIVQTKPSHDLRRSMKTEMAFRRSLAQS